MMSHLKPMALSLVAIALGSLTCSSSQPPERVIYSNSLDSIDSILSKTGTMGDASTSHDGKGSIRIESNAPTTIRLAEIHPEGVENATLIYRGHLRTESLAGQAYLEMWCGIPGKGEFFSKALHAPVSGTTEWVTQETPFFLEKGQRAQTVKLNLVVAGTGKVWVDDVTLALATR
jgi:hypothetical protein